MSSIPHKCCSKCGTDKPLSDFPYEPKAGRYRANCKVCEQARRKAWYEQNKDYFKRRAETHREEMRAASRKYNAANREQRNLASRAQYARDPKKRRDAVKRYRINHSDRVRERYQRWYHNNTDHTKQLFRQYRIRHRGRILTLNHKRRAVSKGVEGSFSEQEWQSLCKRYGYICLACGQKKPLTRDHIIPITKEGSTNYISNIQPLCGPCNSRKGDQIIDYRPDKDHPQYHQETLF